MGQHQDKASKKLMKTSRHTHHTVLVPEPDPGSRGESAGISRSHVYQPVTVLKLRVLALCDPVTPEDWEKVFFLHRPSSCF